LISFVNCDNIDVYCTTQIYLIIYKDIVIKMLKDIRACIYISIEFAIKDKTKLCIVQIITISLASINN